MAASETWAPVANYEGLYEVSDAGRVRNAVSHYVLKPSPNRGYLQVALYRDRRKRTSYVHVLVLNAFKGAAPFSGAQGCHDDGDRSNNHLWNLYWGTAKRNADDRARHGREIVGEAVNTAKLTASDVVQMRERYRTGTSTRAIAREYGLSNSTAWNAVAGKTWRHLQTGASNER